MTRPTEIIIDTNALRHNLAQVRLCAPHSKVIAMVKANAYGHGMIHVAKALHSADALGVASLDEAVYLRESGIKSPLFLMEGLFQANEISRASLNNVVLVIHHAEQIKMLASVKVNKPFHCWLKLNTGMNRLGLNISEFKSAYETLMSLSVVAKPIGLMTHFAEADDLQSHATKKQAALFLENITGYDGPKSLCNSAGILAYSDLHYDWVRPGLMLYGASPFQGETGVTHQLLPVMTFSSQLIAIYPVKRGEKVGYGGTWTADKESLIGIVAAGYGDGYPQQAQNGTPVLIHGKQYSLVGRVSMDMLAVDLNNHHDIQLGDRVVLWGEGLPVEVIAKHANTSAYELLTRMTTRPKLNVKA